MKKNIKKIFYGISSLAVVGTSITSAVFLTNNSGKTSDDSNSVNQNNKLRQEEKAITTTKSNQKQGESNSEEYFPYINDVRTGTGKDQVFVPKDAEEGVTFKNKSSS
jgi:hypothetical protein